MGKYSEALEAANTFIGDGERALVAPYSAVFTDFSNQELIYTRGFAGTDEVKYQATRYRRIIMRGNGDLRSLLWNWSGTIPGKRLS